MYAIGYSFSDYHINKIIREWLTFSEKRNLIIVDPKTFIPNEFKHLINQITIDIKSVSEFMIESSNIENKQELIKENKKFKLLRKINQNEIIQKIVKEIILKKNK